MNSVYIGFDPREAAAFAVARNTARRCLPGFVAVRGIVLADLQSRGFYTRPTDVFAKDGRRYLYDRLSATADYDGRMSTEHAIARFLVPHLAREGWALFMDGDVMVRGNLMRIFDGLNQAKAIYCVKHNHRPDKTTKMDGQSQSRYARKNWSSVMLFNIGHPSNEKLTLEMINTLPGRDLHRFCWLQDDEIGELDPTWNWLAGHLPVIQSPKVVHFTDGVPDMPGYENVPFADEWRDELAIWAGNYSAADLLAKTA